ncbi:hypothetical protein [Mesorhizobium sp. Cs1321R2N1]|uniref:hypothetical protein n=1 Tax=Mesorhizobium sp. Cs1321R2N1 TaxID=3015174 RepID=UPI00301B9D6C
MTLASALTADGVSPAPAILRPSPSLGYCAIRLVPVLGSMKPRRVAAMPKALEINLDRQQSFAIREANEGRPVA